MSVALPCRRGLVALVGVLVWAVLMVSGCHKNPPTTTLRVATWAGPEELAIERANAADFEARHPGVKVDVETIPSNYREKILAGFAARTSPDVFLLDAITVPAFLDRGVLVDLAPYCRAEKVNLGQYYPNVLAVAKRGDHLYAMPKDFTPLVMYYNRDLFRQAGLPDPKPDWTWADFLADARALTRPASGPGGVAQYGTVTYPDFFAWPPWVWSNGGDFLDPTGKRASGYLDSPRTVAAMQFLADLCRRYHVAPMPAAGQVEGDEITLLYTRRVAMLVSGHWILPKLAKYIDSGRLHVGVVPIPHPAGHKQVTVLYESGWAVSVQTKHRRLAAELAIYLANVHCNRRRMAQGLAIPSNKALAKEALAADRTGLEHVFYDQVSHARMPWGAVVSRFGRVEEISQDAFEKALLGSEDMHKALSQASTKIDRVLALPQPKPGAQRTRVLSFVWGAMVLVVLAVVGLIVATRRALRKEAVSAWGFLSPCVTHATVFLLVPLAFSLYLAFHRWSVVDPSTPYIGLGNFAELLHDAEFWNSLKNTFIFALSVPIGMSLALVVALALNKRLPAGGLLRTLFFLPAVSSLVALAMVWKWLYNPEYGLFRYGMTALGLKPLGFLTDPHWALPSLMVMAVWANLGYQVVLFLPGLKAIPQHLYDAAGLDGAGTWASFRHITLPMLRPTTLFVAVTSMIASWQVFTPIYVMTRGGPLRATDVVVYHIYQNAWEYMRMGYAAAMAWVLFAILAMVTYAQFKYVRRGGVELEV